MSKIELGGLNYGENFSQIDYEPLFGFINATEEKGKNWNVLEWCKRCYAFAVIKYQLQKEEYNSRIKYLTDENIKWFTKADQVTMINERLTLRIKELEDALQSKENGTVVPLRD